MTKNTGRGRSTTEYERLEAERRKIVRTLDWVSASLPREGFPEEEFFEKIVKALKLTQNISVLEAIRKAVS